MLKKEGLEQASSNEAVGQKGSSSSSEAVGRDEITTFQDAEDALLWAVEALGCLPDRERGFLAAGSTSSMPRVLRIEQSDYPDRPDPRKRLSAGEVARLEAMLLGPDALVLAIPERHRALVGRVAAMKLWPGAGGFRWSAVRAAMQKRAGEAGRTVGHADYVPAGDALRMRYERAIGVLARAMNGARNGVQAYS